MPERVGASSRFFRQFVCPHWLYSATPKRVTQMPAKVRQRITRRRLAPGLRMARVVCLQSLSPGRQGFQ
jgi:hypothetical protein